MMYAEIWTFRLGPSVKLRDLVGFEVHRGNVRVSGRRTGLRCVMLGKAHATAAAKRKKKS